MRRGMESAPVRMIVRTRPSNQRLERTGGSHALLPAGIRPPSAQPRVVSRQHENQALVLRSNGLDEEGYTRSEEDWE